MLMSSGTVKEERRAQLLLLGHLLVDQVLRGWFSVWVRFGDCEALMMLRSLATFLLLDQVLPSWRQRVGGL